MAVRLSAGQADELEALIDRTSLRGVLDAITQIAMEKADHVASNWGDMTLARRWQRAAKRIDGCATSPAVDDVS